MAYPRQRKRREEFLPLLEHMLRNGMLGKPVLSPPCRDYQHAQWVARGLYLAGRYYCSCGKRSCTRKHSNLEGCPDGGQRLSTKAEVVRDTNGRLCVEVVVRDKQEAIKYMTEKYGPDPMAWPYQPGQRRSD